MIHKSNFENNLKNKGNTFNYYRLIIALLFIFAISVPHLRKTSKSPYQYKMQH